MVAITENEKAVVRLLDHPLYTVEYLEDWVNRNDNPMINAMAALNAMAAKGYYEAVKELAELLESQGVHCLNLAEVTFVKLPCPQEQSLPENG